MNFSTSCDRRALQHLSLAFDVRFRILEHMEYTPRTLELLPEFEAWEQASDEALSNMESELLATSTSDRAATFTLTPRDLDIIYSVGTKKYLSVFQLQTLHFPRTQYYRTATHRLAALVSADLLSRVFYHPRLTANTGRPASIFFLTSANLDTLAALLGVPAVMEQKTTHRW